MTQRAKEMLELASEQALVDFIYEIQTHAEAQRKAKQLWPLIRLAAQADAPGGLDAATVEACAKVATVRAEILRAKAKAQAMPSRQSYFAQAIEARVIADHIRALASGKKP